MFKRLWVRFFLLLVAVSVIALSAALLLRELMVRDFRDYLEGEMEDRVYWVTASLESSFEKYAGWEKGRIVHDTVWALMLGFEVKLYDASGKLVIDTDSAIESLSTLEKKRVMAVSRLEQQRREGRFLPYGLFLGGTNIGVLEVRFLPPKKEMLFVQRSNRLLLISLMALGGIAVFLSIVFSRRLTNPIGGLTAAVVAVGEGDLKRRVTAPGSDEIGRLSGAFNRMAQSLEIQESLRKKLTSNIAHELRTPISAVRGELEGMMDGLIPLDKEHLQSLYAEIGRLRSILEGIEELSQAEASSLTLRKERFELAPFLGNIAGRYKKVFQDKGVALDLRCADGIFIDADPDRLSQILINLLSNALKATAQGGHVRIEAARTASGVEIVVADDGTGVKEEDLQFIFERFYRASPGGLGLGLTIVRELVEAHGGLITAESEPGKGATFTVSFPADS